MSEISERQERQFKNWQWRMGRNYVMTESTMWGAPFDAVVAMEQALDERSQFEWFATSEWCDGYDAALTTSRTE